jgi:ABC-2 type transport system ATP-binding protein
MQAAAIELVGVTKRYGETLALDRVSFAVPEGQVCGFLGPNGAGKTTAIRILLDLIRPSGGKARLAGYDCQSEGVPARSMVGYLPGDLRLYDNLTGETTLRLFVLLC